MENYTRFKVNECKDILTRAFNLAKNNNEFVKINCSTPYTNGIISGKIMLVNKSYFYIDSITFVKNIDFTTKDAWVEIESKWLEEEKPDLEKRIEALEKIVFSKEIQSLQNVGVTAKQPKEVIKDEAWYLRDFDEELRANFDTDFVEQFKENLPEEYYRKFLKHVADQLNKEEGWCPNWYNVNHTKYSFCYDYENKNVVFCCHSILNSGEVVFSQTAIEKCKQILSPETIKKCLGINY